MSTKRITTQSKIYDRQGLVEQISRWRKNGDRIVFTNGCFDILHAGHIRYLESAASCGDRLVIGVNDDASVRRLKGETRPINVLDSRLYLLPSLSCVDAVIPFSEDTPLDLINLLHPDILAKGGDYTPDTIVGAKEVIGWGGSVEVIPFVDGFSTTRLENKILDLHRNKTKDA
jgi:D-beta-D-heptose 7-phosphate kinase/D-beta-D-heptose 1-phosphate adenosyltransferase